MYLKTRNLSQVLYFTDLCFTLHEGTAFSTIPEHSLPNCKLYSNRCRQHASVSSGIKNSCCRRQDNLFWSVKSGYCKEEFWATTFFFSRDCFSTLLFEQHHCPALQNTCSSSLQTLKHLNSSLLCFDSSLNAINNSALLVNNIQTTWTHWESF